MNSKRKRTIALVTVLLSVAGGSALSAQRVKYTLKVPGGLAFSEFRDTRAGNLSPSAMANP